MTHDEKRKMLCEKIRCENYCMHAALRSGDWARIRSVGEELRYAERQLSSLDAASACGCI